MPAGPIKRERIHPRGTMITSWRRREMIREGRPCPRASKTPAAMKATEEIKKLGPIMRRASVPYCISSGSASKIRRIGPGKKMDAIVPVSVTTVTSQGCSEWYCGPCHAFGSIVIPIMGRIPWRRPLQGRFTKVWSLKYSPKAAT